MKTCFYCNGDIVKSITTYFTDSKNRILVIENVPCYKCSQCGEQIYDAETSRKLLEIVKKFDNISTKTSIAIINYENV